DGADRGADARSQVLAHPVHPRSHAHRHHRDRDHRGGPDHGEARVPVRAGAGVREHRARGRGEPHAAQDPGGTAPGDAGAPGDGEAPAFIKEFVSWGAGPRASQYLILGAKARAALDGRPMPDEDDLRAVAPTVLTHRLVINFAAEAAGRSAPDVVEELLVTR